MTLPITRPITHPATLPLTGGGITGAWSSGPFSLLGNAIGSTYNHTSICRLDPNGRLWAVAGANSVLTCYDVSSGTPVKLAEITDTTNLHGGSDICFTADAHYAYTTAETSACLAIYDISAAGSGTITLIGALTDATNLAGATRCAMNPAGTHIAVATNARRGIYIAAMGSAGSVPTFLVEYRGGTPNTSFQGMRCVIWPSVDSAGYIYYACESTAGASVWGVGKVSVDLVTPAIADVWHEANTTTSNTDFKASKGVLYNANDDLIYCSIGTGAGSPARGEIVIMQRDQTIVEAYPITGAANTNSPNALNNTRCAARIDWNSRKFLLCNAEIASNLILLEVTTPTTPTVVAYTQGPVPLTTLNGSMWLVVSSTANANVFNIWVACFSENGNPNQGIQGVKLDFTKIT